MRLMTNVVISCDAGDEEQYKKDEDNHDVIDDVGDDDVDGDDDDDVDDDDDGCHLEHEELHISRGKTSWVLLQVLHSHHHQ